MGLARQISSESQPAQVGDTSAASSEAAIGLLAALLKFVFSWIVLTPIAVIVAGKMLAQRMKFVSRSEQLFKITITGVLNVEARNDEVILGFTGFLITLFAVGGLGGVRAYALFKQGFGVDPGHFNALCVLSAMLLVVWAFTLFIVMIPFRRTSDSTHSDRIEELVSRSREGR